MIIDKVDIESSPRGFVVGCPAPCVYCYTLHYSEPATQSHTKQRKAIRGSTSNPTGIRNTVWTSRRVPERLPESLYQSPVYAVWSGPTTRYGIRCIRWCCATCTCGREHRLPRTVQRLGLHPIETLTRSAWRGLHARAQGMAQSLETIPAAAARRPAGPSEGAPRVRRPGGCTLGRGSR